MDAFREVREKLAHIERAGNEYCALRAAEALRLLDTAVAAEREACAAIAEDWAQDARGRYDSRTAFFLAERIRARGKGVA